MYQDLHAVFRKLKSAHEVVRSIKQLSCVMSINYTVIQNEGRTCA